MDRFVIIDFIWILVLYQSIYIPPGQSSESSTRSMEDILEENAALKYQNQWLIDVITKNISDLSNRIDTNMEEVQEEVSSVR